MARLRAILFDLDGTLVDTRADLLASLNHVLARYGHKPRTAEEVTRFIGDGARTLIARGFGASGDAPSLVDDALDVFLEHYLEHCTDQAALYPGVVDTLKSLNGAALAVITNKPQAPSLAILEKLGIAPFFAAVVGGDQIEKKKPAPEHVWETLKRLNVDPAAAMIVGDSINDVSAGRAAGVKTCGVTYGYRAAEELKQAKPDFLISSFSELRRILQ